ncbi:hypothetical protein WL1483_2963 [Aeromonas schubertii]|uniref:Uncharacterized protein n=1 Tax=Aeromonas schubertii TaxID=652 RepID=A0A0S2SLJ2_9GAMM|nr:hypothetical protein WL1483_2963 [Aeromonas schubertii]
MLWVKGASTARFLSRNPARSKWKLSPSALFIALSRDRNGMVATINRDNQDIIRHTSMAFIPSKTQ